MDKQELKKLNDLRDRMTTLCDELDPLSRLYYGHYLIDRFLKDFDKDMVEQSKSEGHVLQTK